MKSHEWIRVGCAGWSLPKDSAHLFDSTGTHLQRYASRFNAVEINSTFYKSHRRSTYSRWTQSVPATFAFSLKVPKAITHQKKLQDTAGDLATFLADAECLGDKLEAFLVQLPPTLQFDFDIASRFFETFRIRSSHGIVCEPRHQTWFTERANKLFKQFHVARVAADPAIVPEAAEPGGSNQLAYYRLHGSPKRYYSSYDNDYLASLSRKLRDEANSKFVWCIFDNTASGAAIQNANSVSIHLTGSSTN